MALRDVSAETGYLVDKPAQSVVRFTIPAAMPMRVTLPPTDDTVLRAGSYYAASMSGTEPTLTVATSDSSKQVGCLISNRPKPQPQAPTHCRVQFASM